MNHSPTLTASDSIAPIVLMRNPNVGKSALFGALTGRYVEISNYPGTTVEVCVGQMKLLPALAGDEEILARFGGAHAPAMSALAAKTAARYSQPLPALIFTLGETEISVDREVAQDILVQGE